jgi:hypothetical protein
VGFGAVQTPSQSRHVVVLTRERERERETAETVSEIGTVCIGLCY